MLQVLCKFPVLVRSAFAKVAKHKVGLHDALDADNLLSSLVVTHLL